MAKFLIVHVSDTHFAVKQEELRASIPPTWPDEDGDLIGRLTATAYRAIASAHGCNAHVTRLHGLMLDFLRRLREVQDSTWDITVVHTGDVTQAGQPRSMRSALVAIKEACGRRLLAIPGNHDLWPSAFPLFASWRTHVQFVRVRQSGDPFPTSFPSVQALGGGAEAIELASLHSPLGDSIANSLASGALEDEIESGTGQFVAQLDQLRDQLRPRSGALKAVLIHHPVCPLDGQVGHPLSEVVRSVTSSVAFDLRDRSAVEHALADMGVALILCGHEHRLCGNVLHAGGRLLQLPGGCPTMRRGMGNSSEPYLSLYGIEVKGGTARLGWMIYKIESEQLLAQQTYAYDGATWREDGQLDLSLFPPILLEEHRRRPPFS